MILSKNTMGISKANPQVIFVFARIGNLKKVIGGISDDVTYDLIKTKSKTLPPGLD